MTPPSLISTTMSIISQLMPKSTLPAALLTAQWLLWAHLGSIAQAAITAKSSLVSHHQIIQTLVPALFLEGSVSANQTKPYYHHRRVGAAYHDDILYREVETSPSQRYLESYHLSHHHTIHQYPLTHELTVDPVVTPDFIYTFSRDGKLTKFFHHNSTPKWQITLSSYVIQKIVAADALYVVTAYGDVMKIDQHTADILWVSSLSSSPDVLYYHEDAITLKDQRVYIGTRHTVEVFSANGDWLGAYNTPSSQPEVPGGVVGSLSFYANKIHFVMFDGNAYVFAVDDFKSPPLHTHDFKTAITTTLHSHHGIYYGTLFGELIYRPFNPTSPSPLNAARGNSKRYSLTTEPISSILSLKNIINNHPATTTPLLITTTQGKIIGVEAPSHSSPQEFTQLFSTALVSALYAKPIITQTSAPHPTLIFTSTYKNVYSYQLMKK